MASAPDATAPPLRLWETLIAYRELQQAYEAQRRKVWAAALAAYQAQADAKGAAE